MGENELTSSLLEYLTRKLIFQFIFQGTVTFEDSLFTKGAVSRDFTNK